MAAETAQKIITRTLGTTGITLPIVSMGVMNADEEESASSVPRFVDETGPFTIQYKRP
jgi:hypothetical protein